jgi:L-threonylcarbamoyladenylate synthase
MKPAVLPRIAQAVRHLREGGVIAYPTEAVWGLGCAFDNRHAVEKILQLKNRPVHKGVILVSGQVQDFAFLLNDCEPEQLERLQASWPGPNTWLVPHRGQVPPWICGEHSSVAIRVSAHPVIQQLCRGFGAPIVSTSANPQGLEPARQAWRARTYFGDQVHYVAGQVGAASKPSQIRDLITGQIIRPA